VVVKERLREALARLNPAIPPEAREYAFRKITRPESSVPITNNRTFHRQLVDGVAVEYRLLDGRIKGDRVLLVEFEQPENNDWLAVH
jgi:type I restriction enzyme, R subunit